jgi:hypothetical protein
VGIVAGVFYVVLTSTSERGNLTVAVFLFTSRPLGEFKVLLRVSDSSLVLTVTPDFGRPWPFVSLRVFFPFGSFRPFLNLAQPCPAFFGLDFGLWLSCVTCTIASDARRLLRCVLISAYFAAFLNK